MKPSLDEQLMALIRSQNHDRGSLRRWGKKNGYLVSTIDNAVTRLVLHEGRVKPDPNGRLVEIVVTQTAFGPPKGGKSFSSLDPLEEIARST